MKPIAEPYKFKISQSCFQKNKSNRIIIQFYEWLPESRVLEIVKLIKDTLLAN